MDIHLIEKEQLETLAALKQFREDLLLNKKLILSEVKISKEEVEEIIIELLPKDHDHCHDEMRKFLEHSPEARIHGDDHNFTLSVRTRLEHLIVAVFKALGGIILLALLIGLYSWVKHQASI